MNCMFSSERNGADSYILALDESWSEANDSTILLRQRGWHRDLYTFDIELGGGG